MSKKSTKAADLSKSEDGENTLKKGEMPPQFAKKKDGDDDGKTDDDGDGDDDDRDGGDDDGDEDGEKSLDLSTDDLEKSLQKLSAFTEKADPAARKQALLQKAQTGELDASEKEELFKALGGESAKEIAKPLAQDLQKSMEGSATTQDALDVSGYLREQHESLVKSLSTVGEHVEKSDKRQHEFNLLLAKAVTDVGQLVKSVAQAVEAFGGQVARGPKSAGIVGATKPKVLQKSFAGAEDKPEFDRKQVGIGLDRMFEKSMSSERAGFSAGGHDLAIAISKYEQFGEIQKSLLDEVTAELRGGAH